MQVVTEAGTIRTDNRYSIPEDIAIAMHACVRGSYQEDLLSGRENWSGSSLKGDAKKYSVRYARSRDSLLERMQDAVRSSGWSLDTRLVLGGEPRRQRRELVLTNPRGVELVW
jgi:hypothetical protein